MTIQEEIRKLASEKNAVILAHNYCRGEVQDVADYTGDSLELARKAAEIDTDIIVIDLNIYFLSLRHNCYGNGGSMNTSAAFCLGNTLYAENAGFKLETDV